MFKFTHPFFYNLEGASMYVQDKVFGKYARPHWGYRIIELTIILLVMGLTYLTDVLTDWHPLYLVFGYLAFWLICLFSYYSDARYSKITDEYKVLGDFNKLSHFTRYLYLTYVFGFCFLLPLALILYIVIDKLLL